MSGSYELAKRLKDRTPAGGVVIDGSGPLGGWEDAYLVNGAHRECHPDFIATPIGPNPNGFLVCQRKKPEPIFHETKPYSQLPKSRGQMFTQSYDLYSDRPGANPRTTPKGGQALAFRDRRLPNQASLQGSDYYRDSIRFRGIGVETIDSEPGDFGYQENKYYFSNAPPRFDLTHSVQPYELWKREQLRSGNFTPEAMGQFEEKHQFYSTAATF